MDTEGNKSPSQIEDDNFESEEPNDTALTFLHVGVLCGYNDSDIYIPSSAGVFKFIDQDTYLHIEYL